MLPAVCDGGRHAPTAAARLRGRGERGRRIPMPQWLPGRLRRAGSAAMEGRARSMIGSTVRALQGEGMLRRPATVAMDKTLIPFYGNREYMTGRSTRSAAAAPVPSGRTPRRCAGGPCRAQLAARPVERVVPVRNRA